MKRILATLAAGLPIVFWYFPPSPPNQSPETVPPPPSKKAVGRIPEAPAADGEGGRITTPPTPSPDTLARLAEHREYHRSRLEAAPDSAEAHLAYALFLLFQEEYGEADRELEEALKLDPNVAGGSALKGALDRIFEESDPFLRSLTASTAALKAQTPPGPVDYVLPPGKNGKEVERQAREASEVMRKALQARYGSLDRYSSDFEELLRASLISRYGSVGDFESAGRQYDRLSREYPGSPFLPSVYAETLIKGGRIEEARRLVERARARFPSDMHLTVLSDLLNPARERNPGFRDLGQEIFYTLLLLSNGS